MPTATRPYPALVRSRAASAVTSRFGRPAGTAAPAVAGKGRPAGNPSLAPELTSTYKLGYNTLINKSSITFSGYWRQTNNAIEVIARNVVARDILPAADSALVLYTTAASWCSWPSTCAATPGKT